MDPALAQGCARRPSKASPWSTARAPGRAAAGGAETAERLASRDAELDRAHADPATDQPERPRAGRQNVCGRIPAAGPVGGREQAPYPSARQKPAVLEN